ADCDVKATNIILQGLPPEVYALVSTHKVAKELWERIQMLMQGTSLTNQEGECKLYDAFDKFAYQLTDLTKDGLTDLAKEGLTDLAKDGLTDLTKEGLTELTDLTKDGLTDLAKEGLTDLAKDGLTDLTKEGLTETYR
nr:hypothetical protein [Tanacetum cinerariifolium]